MEKYGKELLDIAGLEMIKTQGRKFGSLSVRISSGCTFYGFQFSNDYTEFKRMLSEHNIIHEDLNNNTFNTDNWCRMVKISHK